MSDDHSARAGSLQAHLTSVMMEIDDDDEDIIMVVVDVVNESAIPVGGLQAALVSDKGQRFEPVEGISSIGPGLTRQFKFEANISSGTWSFEFMGGGQTLSMGPYEADFEFQADKGRVLGNAIGSTLFSGVFDDHLSDFGSTEERGIINPDSIIMTSYVGENMEGGGTKVLTGEAAKQVEEDGPRTPPWAASSTEPTALTPLSSPVESPEPEPEPPTPPANDPLLSALTPSAPSPPAQESESEPEPQPLPPVETAATPPALPTPAAPALPQTVRLPVHPAAPPPVLRAVHLPAPPAVHLPALPAAPPPVLRAALLPALPAALPPVLRAVLPRSSERPSLRSSERSTLWPSERPSFRPPSGHPPALRAAPLPALPAALLPVLQAVPLPAPQADPRMYEVNSCPKDSQWNSAVQKVPTKSFPIALMRLIWRRLASLLKQKATRSASARGFAGHFRVHAT